MKTGRARSETGPSDFQIRINWQTLAASQRVFARNVTNLAQWFAKVAALCYNLFVIG
jgi:hypothetical protein